MELTCLMLLAPFLPLELVYHDRSPENEHVSLKIVIPEYGTNALPELFNKIKVNRSQSEKVSRDLSALGTEGLVYRACWAALLWLAQGQKDWE